MTRDTKQVLHRFEKQLTTAIFNDQALGLKGAQTTRITEIATTIAATTFTATSTPVPTTLSPEEIKNHLVSFSADDYGNADAVTLLAGAEFKFSPALGWVHYNGSFWARENAEAALDLAIAETLVQRRHAAVDAEKEAIVKAAVPSTRHIRDCKAQLASRLAVDMAEFDNNPHVINCANGVVDLRTGELTPHDPAQFFTYCIPTNYNPQAAFAEFLTFLRESVKGGAPVVDWLQEFLGYCLTGLTRLEIMLYIYGKTRAGKGTLIESILEVMGGLARGVDFNTFSARRDGDSSNFDLAGLKGCRLVVADESRRYQELNSAKIKQLTGGNAVRCSFKHRDHFEYRPQFKTVLISNFPINADTDDDAMWQRVRVVEFPNSHAGHEDFGLKERFKSQEAQEAILAWMVAGAQRFYARGNAGIPTPKEILTTTQAQRDALDYVGQWINECLEPGDFTTNETLYSSYEGWCKNNGVEPKKQRGLSLTLQLKGYTVGVQRKLAGNNYKGVEGVRVKSTGNGNASNANS